MHSNHDQQPVQILGNDPNFTCRLKGDSAMTSGIPRNLFSIALFVLSLSTFNAIICRAGDNCNKKRKTDGNCPGYTVSSHGCDAYTTQGLCTETVIYVAPYWGLDCDGGSIYDERHCQIAGYYVFNDDYWTFYFDFEVCATKSICKWELYPMLPNSGKCVGDTFSNIMSTYYGYIDCALMPPE
jgi:hypothetical protein